MSADDEKGNGLDERRRKIVDDAIAPAARPRSAGSTPKRHAGAFVRRSSRARAAGRLEPLFRTEVVVCELTVTGVLTGTAWPPVDSIAISGDVQRLSCDEALELVDALLLVVTRMDVVAEERYGATTDETRDREE